MNVVAFAAEERVRRDMHLNQGVTRWSSLGAAAEARTALALEAKHLAFLDPWRDRDVEPLVPRQRKALLAAIGCGDEIDRQREVPIGTGHLEAFAVPPGTPSAPWTGAMAEHREQIIEIGRFKLALGLVLPTLRAFGMRPVGIARPLGAALVDLAAIVARPLLRI